MMVKISTLAYSLRFVYSYIAYALDVEPDPATHQLAATRCNCTFCQKLGITNLVVKDPSDFKLLSPASKSEVDDYAPKVKTAHRYFCKSCGVHVWCEGSVEVQGSKFDFFAINLASVDVDQLPEGMELSKTKVRYWDMLHDNFVTIPSDNPWPGGLL